MPGNKMLQLCQLACGGRMSTDGLETQPSATTYDMVDLVAEAWRGRVRVPHFQRDFRWGRKDVIRLFDSIVRGFPIGSRDTVHIEDLAQVKDVYPHEKYHGSFETIAALVYRGHDLFALREFARRLAFCVMIGNGDAHLKNWSLIYLDKRVPTLSPAYDLVSTAPYTQEFGREDIGLKLGGSRRFETVRLSSFSLLESRIDARLGRTSANLIDVARSTVQAVWRSWRTRDDLLSTTPLLRKALEDLISRGFRTLA